MTPLNEIEKLVKDYAETREVLAQRVQGLEDEVTSLKRKAMPYIRKSVEAAARRKSLLYDAIEAHPELFLKPRTLVIDGIKVGFQKSKGKISWDSAKKVLKRIKKLFPGQKDLLIDTKEVPSKDALAGLPAEDLKKLGVEIESAGDEVVIKSTDNDINKLVNALLKEGDPSTGSGEEEA